MKELSLGRTSVQKKLGSKNGRGPNRMRVYVRRTRGSNNKIRVAQREGLPRVKRNLHESINNCSSRRWRESRAGNSHESRIARADQRQSELPRVTISSRRSKTIGTRAGQRIFTRSRRNLVQIKEKSRADLEKFARVKISVWVKRSIEVFGKLHGLEKTCARSRSEIEQCAIEWWFWMCNQTDQMNHADRVRLKSITKKVWRRQTIINRSNESTINR